MKKIFNLTFIFFLFSLCSGFILVYFAYDTYLNTEDLFTLTFTFDYDDEEEGIVIMSPILDIMTSLVFGGASLYISFILSRDVYSILSKSIKKKLKKLKFR